jgi:hypothetical protein
MTGEQSSVVTLMHGPKAEEQESEVTSMAAETRTNGIDVVGDMVALGCPFCFFYETRDDLVDTLISYCKSGLESGEYCLWIAAEPLTVADARNALKDAVPDLERHFADARIELASARDWFLQGGSFDGTRLTRSWYEKLASVSARGYAGMRVTGDTTWLTNKDGRHFCDYEDGLNEVIGNQRLALLCTYPLAACGAPQILDVVRTHQFVLARRHGNWDVVETAALRRAKAELKPLNDELERRVVERTTQLKQTSEALREAQAEVAHLNRVTAMGQLAARFPMKSCSRLRRESTVSRPPCAGWTPSRRIWRKSGRRSVMPSTKAIERSTSSTGSVLSSRKCRRGRTSSISTRRSWRSLD